MKIDVQRGTKFWNKAKREVEETGQTGNNLFSDSLDKSQRLKICDKNLKALSKIPK